MKLYEIVKELEILEETMNNSDELDTDFLKTYLDEMTQSFDDKLDNIASFIKNINSDVDAIKTEMDNLTARKKQKEKQIENLKLYVVETMQRVNKTKFESSKNKISFRKSEVVEVDVDSFKLEHPELVKKIEIEEIPSKTELKKMFKDIQCDSVKFIEKQNLQLK